MLNRWSERYVPDPFVLAVILTFAALLLGVLLFEGASGDVEPSLWGRVPFVLSGWSDAFFRGSLIQFAFQMCLVLVTGHALALSPPIQSLVLRISHLPKNTAQAAVLVAITALISGVIHWGLGAVVGAFLAREIGRAAAREGRPLHYPILGAAAYMGLLVWHGGLSASAPLKIAEEGHFLADQIGVITTGQTLFSTYNFAITGVIIVLVPVIFWLLTPRDTATFVPFADNEDSRSTGGIEASSDEDRPRFAARLENSSLISLLIGLIGLGWILYVLGRGIVETGSLLLNLNTVNFLFLFAGILAQRTPRRYVASVVDGAKGSAGIILQFPFYFGILGILQASGLIEQFANGLANLASPRTLPLFTFISAGVVNLFVPSGGGQWAVQGEVVVEAASRLGADLNHTIMAFCYGDQLTNMLQPFWALPLLGITGLKARQIIGYTGAVMILVIPVFVVALLAVN